MHPERAELLITVLDVDIHKEGGGGVRVSVLGQKVNVAVTLLQTGEGNSILPNEVILG